MSIGKSEWERMVSGQLYDPADQEIEKRKQAGKILDNDCIPSEMRFL